MFCGTTKTRRRDVIITGTDSGTALRELLESRPKWLAAEIDPPGRQGEASILALAAPGRAPLAFDLQGLPETTKRALGDLSMPVAAFDAKPVARALLRRGFHLPPRFACLRVSELLIQGGRARPTELAELAATYDAGPIPDPSTGIEALLRVTDLVSSVLERQIAALRRDELVWVSRIESQALPAIAEMEHVGVPLDAAAWRALLEDGRRERESLREELAGLLGREGDLFGDHGALDSEPGLREALRRAGHVVPNMKRETLSALPPPLGPKLGRFRELGKLVQAYGVTFLEHVDAEGRIHATFEQIGASTGRMACHSPNLQSVVKDSPYRACFRATEGRALITADYSGCELRILAELSGDPVFRETFARGGDLHSSVASTVFEVPVSKTENPELRQRAKAINFGLAYGMGPNGLARATGLSLSDSQSFLERYFRAFPRIREFLEHTARRAIDRGFAQTMTGRRMYLEHDGTRESRGRAERVAKNMPIQGTNADVVKIALARLRATLADTGAFVVNTVHDEIVVETDEESAEDVARVVRYEMEAAGAEVLKEVPLEVDTAIGPAWAK